MKSYQNQTGGFQSGMATAFPSPITFPHYAIHQGVPYNLYGYSPYSSDYTCPAAYYSLYGGGGAGHQYPLYGGPAGAGNGMVTGANSFYPYFQFGQGQAAAYGLQYPQLFQYSEISSAAGLAGFAAHQQYGILPASLAPSGPAQLAGMPVTLPAPSLQTPAANHHYRLIPSSFPTAAIREQPLA